MKFAGLSLTLVAPALLLSQTAGDPTSVATPALATAVTPAVPSYTRVTALQKAKIRALSVIDPVSFAGSALAAGVDQWRRVPNNRDEGAEGYAIRFASAEGYTAAMDASALIFDETFRLDPRYRRLQEGGLKARIWNAISQTFLAYRDSGGRTINSSEIGGNFSAGFLAGTWEPPGYRSPGDSLERGAIGLLLDTGRNAADEFLPFILHSGKH